MNQDHNSTDKTGFFRSLPEAPHRVMFFAAGIQGVSVAAWWLSDLLGRYAGWYAPLQWAVPPAMAHSFLMIYGLFPFFIFGFLMTAMPNWLGGDRIPQRSYVSAAALMGAGMALFYCGLFFSRMLAALGVLLHLAGWGAGALALLKMTRESMPQDKDARILLTALALGWAGCCVFLLWLASDAPMLADFPSRCGIWFFLLPVFFTVSHRMVPFFSSRVIFPYRMVRPGWALPLMLGGSAAHGVLELAGMKAWLWPVDLPMAATVAFLAVKWGLRRSLQERLLAVLHISLSTLALALLLQGVQSAVLLFSGTNLFGAGPLHAMTIGFFSAMVVGMASRVSLGHSGRPLAADKLTWACFLGLLGAAGLRVAADFPSLSAAGGMMLSVLAVTVWLLCFIPWAWHYVPMYLRPRLDGRPG